LTLALGEAAHEEAFVRQEARGAWASSTLAELALQDLRAWALEQRRKSTGAVRMVLIARSPSDGDGPDAQFAVPLR